MKKDNKIIETKAFWEQVKKEYDTSVFQHICTTSDSFNEVWGINREDIWKLGEEFLKSEKINNHNLVTGGYDCLFYAGDKEEGINIRKEFIDWCINKFN